MSKIKKDFAPVIKAVNESLVKRGEQPLSSWNQTVVSTVLESFSKATGQAMDRSANESATQPRDVSFLRTHGINILAASMTNLIANNLVSVQPLQARVGELRYLDVQIGDDKGTFKRGDSIYSHERVGGEAGHFDYSASEVTQEALIFSGNNATLAWLPVLPETVVITSADGMTTVTDNGEGKLFSAGSEVGTIDYATGALTTTAANTDSSAAYRYDNISSPVKAPSISLKLKPLAVIAQSRKLRTDIAFDAMYDLQEQYDYSADKEQVALVTNYLQAEIDGELIEDMLGQAKAASTSFKDIIPVGVSQLDHYESFYASLTEGSNNIFEATRFISGNWAVTGITGATILESLGTRGGFQASGIVANGPHLSGSIGNIEIYKSPMLSNRDAYVVGAKGDSPFHAGMIYAPYLPIMSTDMISDDQFSIKQGFATSYAKRMVNANLYSKGIITKQ